MQIQTNYANIPSKTNIANKTVNHTFKRGSTLKQASEECLDYYYNLSGKCGLDVDKIKNILELATKKQAVFFDALVGKYNHMYGSFGNNLAEKPETIVKVYEQVKKPTSLHHKVARSSRTSFKNLQIMFSLADDKKSLLMIQKIQDEILPKEKHPAKTIIALLSSPNKKMYTENIERFSSYLKLNHNAEDAVPTLDNLIAEGKYNKSDYDKELQVKRMFNITSIKQCFENKEDVFRDNFTPEKSKFVTKFLDDYLYDVENKSVFYEDAIELFHSVTSENYAVRKRILDEFKYSKKTQKKDLSSQEIASMKMLFDKIDNNKDFHTFIKKILESHVDIESITALNDIAEIVPPKKGTIFIENLKRIVNNSQGEERTEALKNELENPFFVSKRQKNDTEQNSEYGFISKEDFFERAGKYIRNKWNQLKYSFVKEAEPAVTAKRTQTIAVPEEIFKQIELPAVEEEQPKKIIIKNSIKETPKERKIRLSKEVNDYVKSILGKKTYETQNGIYTEKVTKMRLSLLPEIFASIKENRINAKKEIKENANTTRKVRSDNRDAVKLYQLINGKNKKLIRYMLEQRDSEGKRIYEVKDIIKNIKDAETTIAQQKKENPNYTPKDAREYYAKLYENQVADYGKLKLQRKKSIQKAV